MSLLNDALPPAAWAFLAFSSAGAVLAVSSVLRVRKIGYLTLPYFALSMFATGMTPQFAALGAVSLLVFWSCGGVARWPGITGLALVLVSFVLLALCHRRSARSAGTLEQALQVALGPGYRDEIPADRACHLRGKPAPAQWLRPFHMRDAAVERIADLRYGDAGERNLLDVYRPRAAQRSPMPILLQIHGSGWTVGNKTSQALPLMYHLARCGWMCVAINYRLSPTARLPDHLIDVKRSIAWIRSHAKDYGADPDLLVVTGGSAGGHLAALAALTANDPRWQPGFEHVDTKVMAAVPLYGVFNLVDYGDDWASRKRIEFLARNVMPGPLAEIPQFWDAMSPLAQIHAGAPPFFVIHGTHDSITPVEEAQAFVGKLSNHTRQPLAYAELHGAQHAFDLWHCLWTEYAVDAIHRFLEVCLARRT